MIDVATIFKQSAHQVSCDINDEVAILNLDRSVYFGLKGVGAHIWASLAEPCSVSQICESVERHFDVAPQTCRDDVLKFLESLQEAGLIEAQR
jgi:hypothetical protein